jgi:hypothetical protein
MKVILFFTPSLIKQLKKRDFHNVLYYGGQKILAVTFLTFK